MPTRIARRRKPARTAATRRPATRKRNDHSLADVLYFEGFVEDELRRLHWFWLNRWPMNRKVRGVALDPALVKRVRMDARTFLLNNSADIGADIEAAGEAFVARRRLDDGEDGLHPADNPFADHFSNTAARRLAEAADEYGPLPVAFDPKKKMLVLVTDEGGFFIDSGVGRDAAVRGNASGAAYWHGRDIDAAYAAEERLSRAARARRVAKPNSRRRPVQRSRR